jgi:hypothetical protein
MPLIPVPVDTTPLIAPPPVAAAMTRAADTGHAPPRATESGTSVLARALRVNAVPAWLDRLMHEEPAWPNLLILDDPYTEPTGTVTYDIALLPLRIAGPEATATPEPDMPAPTGNLGARAYAAFKDLGRWLMLDDPTVARMVGIKRTTPYAWVRESREPRPATVRLLLQHHAVVAAVVDRLGTDGAWAWLAAGSPNPVELLLAGRLDAVDEQVGELVFARTVATPPAGGYLPEHDDDPAPLHTPAGRG